MSATKYCFDKSFDNGASLAATTAEKEHDKDIDAAKEQGEIQGYKRGYDSAMTEISAQTHSILAVLSTKVEDILFSIDSVKRQLIADSAIIATVTGRSIGNRLIEKLPQERIEHLVEEIMNDIIDVPRLVVRIPPILLDSTRMAVERISQAHGFAGRIIFMSEPSYGASDITIEWANGGVNFAQVNQNNIIQNSSNNFVDSILNNADLNDEMKVYI
jgi:flagellar biosynthesis/type III secretory pathway protein FliH